LQQGKLKPIILIDVRSPEEHATDHITGSILVPIDEIESGNGAQQIQEIINQKSLPINQNPQWCFIAKLDRDRTVPMLNYTSSAILTLLSWLGALLPGVRRLCLMLMLRF
jgi:hypothetical protein